MCSEVVSVSSHRNEKNRLDFIDVLRGLACLWVLLHHSFESLPAGTALTDFPLNIIAPVAKIGWLGVSLFLVLSGFCLYYPVVRQAGPEGARLDVRKFARRRAIRILPPYLATVVLFTAIAWFAARNSMAWGENVRIVDVVTHALMLHNLRPSTFASINPALWSLALEVQLYVIFPLFVVIAARRGLKSMLAFAFAIALATQTAAWLKYGLSLEWRAEFAVAYHSLPARCFEFAAGMCAAAMVARPKPNLGRPALAIVLILLGPALWFVLRVSRFGPLCDPVWGVVFASAVVMLSRLPAVFFRQRPLRALTWFGTVSYSVYLLHQPITQFLAPQHLHLPITGSMSVVAFLIVRIVVVSSIGVAFFYLLEKPCITRAARPAPRVEPLPLPSAGQVT